MGQDLLDRQTVKWFFISLLSIRIFFMPKVFLLYLKRISPSFSAGSSSSTNCTNHALSVQFRKTFSVLSKREIEKRKKIKI